MSQEYYRRAFVVGIVMLEIVSCALISVPASNSRPKTKKFSGHVFGYRLHPLKNMGDGPDGEYFVFIPDSDKAKVKQVPPVLIAYSFFWGEADLPDSFFDYTKHFQIKVSRNADCDDTAEGVFYIKDIYVDEPQKPPGRHCFFRLSSGAPEMHFADDLKLPCYEMRPGNYSQLK